MYIYQRMEIKVTKNIISDIKILDAFEDPYLLVEKIDETYVMLDEIEFDKLTERFGVKIKAAGPIFYKKLDKENECLILMSKNKIIKS
ncbi:hypothetical protein [Spiroplasma floricola]|uniref:Uncharacterized protein n=1 Tax=Spiroplasma floricola 23-6 TaxID=1336749 RepID=A0A2K8SEM0_9MOLU|nr:hypothetical protein [Spiroplasma floricola]AUB31805.1 hypothetical protein SFLOR_v1c07570 [Spiroplasma floricola 23-6]